MIDIFKHFTHFTDKFQTILSLGEGNTPLITAKSLAKRYNMDNIYLKDETKNPSGSFKDRATASQMTYWKNQGYSNFVISSSGNAAISCALYAKSFNLSLDIFLSEHTASYKIERLNEIIGNAKDSISIHYSKRAKKDAFVFAKEHNYINLIASRDDHALDGYVHIGEEIIKEIEDDIHIDGIFMPVSSGTGLLGIAQATGKKIPLYAVQTTKSHLIAQDFVTEFIQSETSLAGAIMATYNPRKNAIIQTIKHTHGSAFIISDEEIKEALQDVFETESLTISNDSALAVAGLKKALRDEMAIKNAVCILTGK